MQTLNQTTRKNGITYHNGRPSKFLTICDNILEGLENDTVFPSEALNESFEGEYPHETFDELYEQMMSENARSTFRTDPLLEGTRKKLKSDNDDHSLNLRLFEKSFRNSLDGNNYESEEEPVLNTERTKPYFASDGMGNKVEINPDQRPYTGKNGKIIAVSKSDRVVHDIHNQAYAIPKGAKYFKNKDGTLTVQKKTGQGDALKMSKKLASNPNGTSVIEGSV